MTKLVSIVSSGPGDPELLTLKAVDRLQRAQVVLYDDLGSGAILPYAPQAELVSVGKRAGRSSPRQQHVSRLLVEYAQHYERVVRLKSGDAGIFGRLEEELQALTSADVPFEIIPGVTSACAAAAALGLPLTRRLQARRLQFITGTDIMGRLPDTLHWEALTDPTAITVIYMGRRTFPHMAKKLIAGGLSDSTPAYLVEALGSAEEEITRSTLSELAQELAQTPRHKPALILYGPLVDFGKA